MTGHLLALSVTCPRCEQAQHTIANEVPATTNNAVLELSWSDVGMMLRAPSTLGLSEGRPMW